MKCSSQSTINGVGTTPVTLILAIPSRRIHPSITPHRLVAVCCVICWLFHEVYPIHAKCQYPQIHVYWYHILQFDRFSASPLNSDEFRPYPMHMRLNGASKTLIRLIEGVLPISHLIQGKNTCRRQQSDCYSAPEPPTTAAPPPNESAESADEVDCSAAQRPLWMAAVHGKMREEDSSPWLPCGVWSFDVAFPETGAPAQNKSSLARGP